jgi:DNA primase
MHVASLTERVALIRKIFGEAVLARDGVNIAVACPSCNNTQKKKFSINLKTGQCHCWVCDLRGKNLIFVLKKFGKSGFLSEYCQKFNVDNRGSERKETAEDVEISLPEGFVPVVDCLSSRDPDIKACISYLQSRKVSEKDMWYFKIGVSTSRRFRRRVIFPSFDSDGDLNFYVARCIDADTRIKYSNAPVNKQDIVFNEININWKKEIEIVEGPFDLLRAGYNSTCLLGARLSTDSLLFSKIVHNTTPVLLCLDSDMVDKSHNIARILSEYGCAVRTLDLGSYSDVGEMSKKDFALRKDIAESWSRNNFILNKIRSIESGSIV